MSKPTTDWGDDWVEPDINKRFGIPKKKRSGAWIAVLLLVVLACLAFKLMELLT